MDKPSLRPGIPVETVESATTAWTEYRYIIISRKTKRTLENGQTNRPNSDNNKTDILFGQLSKTNSAR